MGSWLHSPSLGRNGKSPQAWLSYLGAGKLISLPPLLGSSKTQSLGPMFSHPLTSSRSQASEITLVKISLVKKKISLVIGKEFNTICTFLGWWLIAAVARAFRASELERPVRTAGTMFLLGPRGPQ